MNGRKSKYLRKIAKENVVVEGVVYDKKKFKRADIVPWSVYTCRHKTGTFKAELNELKRKVK